MNNSTTKSNSKAVWNMLVLSLLTAAAGVQATCITDPPELGDIGPGSELVCRHLADQFADAELAVLDRAIRTPTAVTVLAAVNGTPITIDYELIGYDWRLNSIEAVIAAEPWSHSGLSMRE